MDSQRRWAGRDDGGGDVVSGPAGNRRLTNTSARQGRGQVQSRNSEAVESSAMNGEINGLSQNTRDATRTMRGPVWLEARSGD